MCWDEGAGVALDQGYRQGPYFSRWGLKLRTKDMNESEMNQIEYKGFFSSFSLDKRWKTGYTEGSLKRY
jgi:hypothetical protein